MYRLSAVLGLLGSAACSLALDLEINNAESIKSAAKAIVANIINYYEPNEIPGVFPESFFIENGLAFDSLVNYWALTGDTAYVNLTHEALVWQVGTNYNYMPGNWSSNMGNDDQSTWGLAAMTAAETQFPAPASNLSWVQLAQNVFDSQAARWDTETCAGGLRWQIYMVNLGYEYKNAITNGNFAQLAARLARFTGNQTYTEWANKAITWSQKVDLITTDGNVWDGFATDLRCAEPNKIQWTSSFGTYISAAAFLSNMTGGDESLDLLEKLLSTANEIFINPNASVQGVLFESACQPLDNCEISQSFFRSIFARALAYTNALTSTSNSASASTLHTNVTRIVQASGEGAAAQCSGGSNGTICGADWASNKWDEHSGLGNQLSALEILLANLPITQLATSSTPSSNNSLASPSTNGTSSSNNTTDASQDAQTNGASSLMSSALLPLIGLGMAALL